MTWRQELQRSKISSRIVGLRVLVTAIFLFLLFAFWEIQVLEGDHYRVQAEQNRIKTLPVPAARGNILDRRGRVMAQSVLALSAMIDTRNGQPGNLRRIANGLGLDLEHVRARLRDTAEYGRSEHVVLKENLSISDIAFLQAHRREFPEIDLIESMRRKYPDTGVAVHAIGHVGEVSKSELSQREFLLYDYGAVVGKSGAERQYNQWLAGEDGELRFLVDSLGRQLALLGRAKPIPGNNLRLTIDLDLQVVAELGLEGRKGAVVALDPRNGEILTMASAPVYDANKFVTGFSGQEWRALGSDPSTPMLNRAIQGQWALGSVFKPIVALGGLEANLAGTDFRVQCGGGLQFGGRYFRCHKRGGHGTVGLRKAIAQSCDVYFYRLGDRLGIEALARYAHLAGLGSETRVDLPNELPGLVPTVRWKVRELLQPWHPGETIVVSIGQGAMSVTPIQAAHAIGGLAMGGVWHRPRLVSQQQLSKIRPDAEPQPPRRVRIAADHKATLREAMWMVVNGAGTGRQARLAGVDVCGKTGTSQRVSNALRLKAKREDFEDDAWFVGFAPCHNPEIVVAVLLENGRHSYYAAAVARDVLQTWWVNRDADLMGTTDGALAMSMGKEG